MWRRDLGKLLGEAKTMSEQLLLVVKENTASFTLNTEVIRALHRRLDIVGEETASARKGRPGDPAWDGTERRSGQEPRRGDRRVRLTET